MHAGHPGQSSKQTESKCHVNKPRERHFLAIRSRYFAECVGGVSHHRNQRKRAAFKKEHEKFQAPW